RARCSGRKARPDLPTVFHRQARRHRAGPRDRPTDRRAARRHHHRHRLQRRRRHLHRAASPMNTRILIIDDEANIRRMVGSLLKAEGFEVAEAANGNAGLLAIPEVRPELILLDLMMPPGPDGLATLERIRASDAEIPVIMMSGKAQLSDAVRAVQMGAFQFLEKPLAPESLLVAVRSAETLVRTQAENRALRAQLGPEPDLIGQSQ